VASRARPGTTAVTAQTGLLLPSRPRRARPGSRASFLRRSPGRRRWPARSLSRSPRLASSPGRRRPSRHRSPGAHNCAARAPARPDAAPVRAHHATFRPRRPRWHRRRATGARFSLKVPNTTSTDSAATRGVQLRNFLAAAARPPPQPARPGHASRPDHRCRRSPARGHASPAHITIIRLSRTKPAFRRFPRVSLAQPPQHAYRRRAWRTRQHGFTYYLLFVG
jgi:hypothetical protein